MQTPVSSAQTPAKQPNSRVIQPRLTMYDLPSQFPGERGLPDEYHDLQPEYLSATLRLSQISATERFSGTDMCLYYDEAHPLWHKRPDWFLSVGVPRLYGDSDLRLSYTTWDEGVAPCVIVELISPGTEKQDLGPFYRSAERIDLAVPDEAEVDAELGDGQLSDRPLIELIQSRDQNKPQPPSKWEVYEQILKVPYYVTYSRYSNQMRCFCLVEGRYAEVKLNASDPRFYLEDLGVGLGLWQGEYQGITRPWLRWFDQDGNWLLTEAESERQQRLDLLKRLEQAGIDLDGL